MIHGVELREPRMEMREGMAMDREIGTIQSNEVVGINEPEYQKGQDIQGLSEHHFCIWLWNVFRQC